MRSPLNLELVSVDAVEKAATSTAADGLAGRDEAAAEIAFCAGSFLSLPRPFPLGDTEVASLVALDGPTAVAGTGRFPLDVTLVGRPLGAEGPVNGVTVAGASTGVPPFCPHDAERGRAGTRNALMTYGPIEEKVYAAYHQTRQLCGEIGA